jgi:hypothetical protein
MPVVLELAYGKNGTHGGTREMKRVAFGGAEHERLEIVVHGYERQAMGDYYDDNWLTVNVSIQAGSFQGRFQTAFLTAELEAFRDELRRLLETLKGEAVFHTLEEQLTLTLQGDGLGHIQVHGKAIDQAGIGNCLEFGIAIEQTQLQASLRALEAVVKEYPVRTL